MSSVIGEYSSLLFSILLFSPTVIRFFSLYKLRCVKTFHRDGRVDCFREKFWLFRAALKFVVRCTCVTLRRGTGGDRDSRWGKRETILTLHCHQQNDSSLRWASSPRWEIKRETILSLHSHQQNDSALRWTSSPRWMIKRETILSLHGHQRNDSVSDWHQRETLSCFIIFGGWGARVRER